MIQITSYSVTPDRLCVEVLCRLLRVSMLKIEGESFLLGESVWSSSSSRRSVVQSLSDYRLVIFVRLRLVRCFVYRAGLRK